MRSPESALRLLGLAARSGAVIPGTQMVRDAARRERLRMALVADDASENALDKLVPLLGAKRVPVRMIASRARLGEAVGKGPLSAVGVTDRNLAFRLLELTEEPGEK